MATPAQVASIRWNRSGSCRNARQGRRREWWRLRGAGQQQDLAGEAAGEVAGEDRLLGSEPPGDLEVSVEEHEEGDIGVPVAEEGIPRLKVKLAAGAGDLGKVLLGEVGEKGDAAEVVGRHGVVRAGLGRRGAESPSGHPRAEATKPAEAGWGRGWRNAGSVSSPRRGFVG